MCASTLNWGTGDNMVKHIGRGIALSASLTLFSGMIGACGGADEDEDVTLPDPLSEQMFARRIITVHEDGTYDETVVEVSLAQQIAERDGLPMPSSVNSRSGQSITIDPAPCASSSLQLYDQTGWTGNQLCLQGTSSNGFNFGAICRPTCLSNCGGCATWAANVESYKTGDNSVLFSDVNDFTSCVACPNIRPSGLWYSPAASCEAGAAWLKRPGAYTGPC